MSDENSHLAAVSDKGVGTVAGRPDGSSRHHRLRLWVNWVLALLTIPAAAVVLVFAFGAVLSTAGCSGKQCNNIGPSWLSPDVVFYGTPVVALAAIIITFFTARRRWGFVVPLIALALLGAEIAVVATTVAR